MAEMRGRRKVTVDAQEALIVSWIELLLRD